MYSTGYALAKGMIEANRVTDFCREIHSSPKFPQSNSTSQISAKFNQPKFNQPKFNHPLIEIQSRNTFKF